MSDTKRAGDGSPDQQSLRHSNETLLGSGMLADAEVRCGARTWKVHKAILCTRSEWFKKALMGHFKEAATGVVTIEICTEDEVDLLLHYLYTGVVNVRKLVPGDNNLINLVRVWKLADFFCLPGLRHLSLQARDKLLKKLAYYHGICEPYRPADMREIDGTIRSLYEEDSDDIREHFRHPLLAVMLLGAQLLAKEPVFKKLVHELTEFGSDWALGLMGCLGDVSKPRDPHRLYNCGKCGGRVEWCTLNFAKWVKVRLLETHCAKCIAVPTWEDWVGKTTENNGTTDKHPSRASMALPMTGHKLSI